MRTNPNIIPSHVFHAEPVRLSMPSTGDNELRDWLMSSLELREGLNVKEILDTLPAELLDLM